MNLPIVEINIELFLTCSLVLFGALQWLAVKKQNNQNLFKMRLSHYQKFCELSNSLSIKIEHYEAFSSHHEVQLEEFESLVLELDNYIAESKFLFDKKLYLFESEFYNSANTIYKKINKNKTIPITDIKNLNDFFDDGKTYMEIFLENNKP